MNTETMPVPSTTTLDRSARRARAGGSVAWIAREADVDRALTEICRMLRQRFAGAGLAKPALLSGVWISATNPVAEGSIRNLDSGVATSSLDDSWSVMWPDTRVSRDELLATLAETDSNGRFLPVFSSEEESADVDHALAHLRSEHPAILAEPVLQHPETGWLWPRSA